MQQSFSTQSGADRVCRRKYAVRGGQDHHGRPVVEKLGLCPSCGTVSRRVHSHYRRRVTDLPLSGRIVQLVVIARRFHCDAVLCGRQIFTERFGDDVLAPSARRTTWLDCIVHHLDLALGGRPAAGFAKRLMLPVSNDTLLRVVRRRSRPPADQLAVVGIDDWAWRRNHRYASIICNLERRRIVTLLPDREPATAQAWFAAHPTIAVVARDRGGGYGEAADGALPHAVQVADRWHLMENASRAFLMRFENRCARYARSSARPRSIPSC
jgi:transposase